MHETRYKHFLINHLIKKINFSSLIDCSKTLFIVH